MLKEIVAYVNFLFPAAKSQFYDDNFIKACLVYQFLYAKYFSRVIDLNSVINKLSADSHSIRTKSRVLTNHLIFNLGFKAFWNRFKLGRGSVYVFDSGFQENEVIGYLTGILYWVFHGGVV